MRTSALRRIPRAPAQSRAGERTLDPPDPEIVPNGIDSDEVTDATLVQQLVAGSAEALASLYDRYASEVFAAVIRMNGDRSTASEIVQETFLADNTRPSSSRRSSEMKMRTRRLRNGWRPSEGHSPWPPGRMIQNTR
jgi:hypothetical protein